MRVDSENCNSRIQISVHPCALFHVQETEPNRTFTNKEQTKNHDIPATSQTLSHTTTILSGIISTAPSLPISTRRLFGMWQGMIRTAAAVGGVKRGAMGSILAIVGGGGEGLAAPGEEYVHFFLCWLGVQ
jgi:hypothetical protein